MASNSEMKRHHLEREPRERKEKIHQRLPHDSEDYCAMIRRDKPDAARQMRAIRVTHMFNSNMMLWFKKSHSDLDQRTGRAKKQQIADIVNERWSTKLPQTKKRENGKIFQTK